tara:strand:+ start:181 stop:408 length:228 start_codon:yes stop_codon:yes gene_type:complete
MNPEVDKPVQSPATKRVGQMVSVMATCIEAGRYEDAKKIYSNVLNLLEEIQERLEFAEWRLFGASQEPVEEVCEN